MRGAPDTVPERSLQEGEHILFPTQAFNPIRFNGIRQLPISAPHMGHPDKNPASLINPRG